MRSEILSILECPLCHTKLELTPFDISKNEIRRGALTCKGDREHLFEVKDGIIRFQSGFDHDAVKKELEYENSTYHGDARLTDPKLIAQFPDTLAEIWPHICNFGPDFRALIDTLKLPRGAWVLDVGTGPCWSTRLLAERGYNAIALDVNDANFYGLGTGDIMFEAHDIYFERILESMTNLPFGHSTLDAITFNASFHHTPDMEKTLSECRRVLRPGGVIAMVNEEMASVRQKFFKDGSVTDTGSHHTVLYSDFEASRKRHGFEISYFVAEHVRASLEKRLSGAGANVMVKMLETIPGLLKQLNSALIILKKPGILEPRSNPTTIEPPRRRYEAASLTSVGAGK